MSPSKSRRTDPSLMRRLQAASDDPTAWDEFIRVYGPLIRDWCRRWKLQASDADDLTQDVLVKLVRRLRSFRYDPARSFRAYLKTVTRYVAADFFRDRPMLPGFTAAAADLDTMPAARDLEQILEERYDQELVDQALIEVCRRVDPATWAAFRLTTYEQLPGNEVAARVGLPIASVWKARSNVLRMVRTIVRDLEADVTPALEASIDPLTKNE